jgi:hypothetical protein
MKRVMTCLFAAALLGVPSLASAQATGTIVFDSIPKPTPGNVPSQGYQCCATAEFGDLIKLEADTPRFAGSATVLMSSWALHSTYPTMDAAGYTHPITLNLYFTEAKALAHTPDVTITKNALIPWRPEADPACGTAWKGTDGICYNGFAFTLTFDLKSLNVTLPDSFIFGVAFNTNTWGYTSLGVAGPYESLNVGLSNVAGAGVPPSVGADVDPDVVFWNTSHGPFYTDGGASGIGTFRQDTGWTGFQPAVQFTTFGFPETAGDCKNGAWRNLVRRDFSAFKNQGDCVSYVTTGK